MKRWLCVGLLSFDLDETGYVAADSEAHARSRCRETLGFNPETVTVVPWPDRRREITRDQHGISLLAKP